MGRPPFKEYIAGVEPDRILLDVQITPFDNDHPSKLIVLRYGQYVMVLNPMALTDHLCLDVHPYVDGQAAEVAAMGMTNGARHAFDRSEVRATSQGWPAVSMLAAIVGAQGTTFVRASTEEPQDGADAIGGDVQASDVWSARLVWSATGRHIVRTAYAYAVGCTDEGERLDVDEPESPHHYEIDVLVDEITCTDAEDPGSTQLDADVTYPGLGTYRGRAIFATADEAMAAGQQVIQAWIDAQPAHLVRNA